MTPIYILFVMPGLMSRTLLVNFCKKKFKSYNSLFEIDTKNVPFFFCSFIYFLFNFFHSALFHYLVLESQSNNLRPQTSRNGLKGHCTSKLGRKKAASHINTNNCVISLQGKTSCFWDKSTKCDFF